ncbi:CCA tRNA nucleotidyltransferase [Clostridium autoethanogenum]|uniref:CCA tRNA nucleotidyltransferase n=1 Tax=Clostridium autoethanogenum TaxID=84023 RepID=A0A3M0SDR6_9CLOT|nr:CCA tRNA nucleotidyltransferase [Clostridium autoethanogenum]RMC96365.1 CCA tRNA nucleotidyltransferase [Clostridium autoethanogenum]
MNILKAFTIEQIQIINLIKAICKSNGIKAYIVGGAVRDAFLGNKVKDIDICIDKNPNFIIGKLNGIKCFQYYDKFQTASLLFQNEVNIDLIRCRKEYYARDGELPIIDPSNIYDDLRRRDFTANALAYDIVTGSLIDIYGGLEDIKNKILQKIHLNSYREDPTRIFRAVKYAVRYGFDLKDKDEIINCVNEGVFNLISNDRIVKEIYLLCEEKMWIKNILMCGNLKIFNVNREKLEIGNENYNNTNKRILRLFYALEDKKCAYILGENSVLDSKLKVSIKNFTENYQKITSAILNTMDNYELYKILKGINDYGLILLKWNDKLKYKIYNYVHNMYHYKSSLNGKLISSIGIQNGKAIGEVLNYMTKIELNSMIKYGKKYLVKNLGEII